MYIICLINSVILWFYMKLKAWRYLSRSFTVISSNLFYSVQLYKHTYAYSYQIWSGIVVVCCCCCCCCFYIFRHFEYFLEPTYNMYTNSSRGTIQFTKLWYKLLLCMFEFIMSYMLCWYYMYILHRQNDMKWLKMCQVEMHQVHSWSINTKAYVESYSRISSQ